MKSMKPVALALGAIPLLVASLAWGQGGNPPASTKESGATSGHGMTAVEQTTGGNVGQQVKTLHEQGREAALKSDTSFLSQYLADDYTGIGGDGSLLTKDQAIQRVKSGAVKYQAIDEREVKVRVYGNTAVINARAMLKATIDGKPIDGDYRATFVWVKRDGKWQEVAFEATPVMPQSK